MVRHLGTLDRARPVTTSRSGRVVLNWRRRGEQQLSALAAVPGPADAVRDKLETAETQRDVIQ